MRILPAAFPPPSPAREAIAHAYLREEAPALDALAVIAQTTPDAVRRIQASAARLIEGIRARPRGGIDAFLHEYSLSSQEGVALMCLAEALLRIPDAGTADRLIQDKLARADWERHLGSSDSLLVNAATWALMLTGRMVALEADAEEDLAGTVRKLVARSGEPVVRAALTEAMRILGRQFVLGRTIEEALAESREDDAPGTRYSFDMLGEAALTRADARRFHDAYAHAIASIGGSTHDDPRSAAGISIKLSALHPRFQFSQRARLARELVPSVLALVRQARAAGVAVTLDAEEADRLEPLLDIFEAVFGDPALSGWPGFGLAVQAYQKRALPVIDWLAELARANARAIPVRLVKGAYWDTEIKRAQERGLSDYPVFTRKLNTDVSYLACARRLAEAGERFYPQFATHNAYTVAAVMELMGGRRDYEFQRLHGMGEALYRELLARRDGLAVRVYAPVGTHAELLPYLVRRLLENGANTSFVNRIEDQDAPIESLTSDPVAAARRAGAKRHERIPLPADLYRPERRNSAGVNFHDPVAIAALERSLHEAARATYHAAPLIGGRELNGAARSITNPADSVQVVGEVREADANAVDAAFAAAAPAAIEWAALPVDERAGILARAADLFEQQRAQLLYLCVREGGRTLIDAEAELREAVDYCRYYGAVARQSLSERTLPGPTGERNRLCSHGRGTIACISPWNFPLAIFAGQVAGALAAGNAVIAKPARQTPLVAMRAVELLHEAGVPTAVLQLVPGSSAVLSEPLLDDARLAGVVFTGSTDSARAIQRRLAARAGPILPLIAETGGINAMIADSSALPEQVVMDAVQSAFNSAGQRCSALRVLFLQSDIAARVSAMLAGAMEEIHIGDPMSLATDVGPLIDAAAKRGIDDHVAKIKEQGTLIAAARLGADGDAAAFFAPMAVEIDELSILRREVFGPVLHVIRYDGDRLDAVIDAVNSTGYGLTLGVHSRIEATASRVRERARVGNIYVNRNMIGAVVGVQPFGGEGLSGTGPKAGGPNYLQRLAVERTYTENTAALGGNATLLTLKDE